MYKIHVRTDHKFHKVLPLPVGKGIILEVLIGKSIVLGGF